MVHSDTHKVITTTYGEEEKDAFTVAASALKDIYMAFIREDVDEIILYKDDVFDTDIYVDLTEIDEAITLLEQLSNLNTLYSKEIEIKEKTIDK